jgi:serine/threonine-protein kinase RsbW
VATTEGAPSHAAPADDPTRLTAADASVRDVVSVRLPASAAYLAVLRTTTASLAARLDFTLDEIEDLRIAVDEASCLLLAGAAEGAELTSVFEMFPDSIQVSVSTMTDKGHPPERDSFAWTVLTALAGHVDAWTEPDGRQTISLVKHRSRDASA